MLNQSHNPKVVGSNPAPATKNFKELAMCGNSFFYGQIFNFDSWQIGDRPQESSRGIYFYEAGSKLIKLMFLGTMRANTVAEVCFGELVYVILNRVPIALFIADTLAIRVNWKQVLQDLDFIE